MAAWLAAKRTLDVLLHALTENRSKAVKLCKRGSTSRR